MHVCGRLLQQQSMLTESQRRSWSAAPFPRLLAMSDVQVILLLTSVYGCVFAALTLEAVLHYTQVSPTECQVLPRRACRDVGLQVKGHSSSTCQEYQSSPSEGLDTWAAFVLLANMTSVLPTTVLVTVLCEGRELAKVCMSPADDFMYIFSEACTNYSFQVRWALDVEQPASFDTSLFCTENTSYHRWTAIARNVIFVSSCGVLAWIIFCLHRASWQWPVGLVSTFSMALALALVTLPAGGETGELAATTWWCRKVGLLLYTMSVACLPLEVRWRFLELVPSAAWAREWKPHGCSVFCTISYSLTLALMYLAFVVLEARYFGQKGEVFAFSRYQAVSRNLAELLALLPWYAIFAMRLFRLPRYFQRVPYARVRVLAITYSYIVLVVGISYTLLFLVNLGGALGAHGTRTAPLSSDSIQNMDDALTKIDTAVTLSSSADLPTLASFAMLVIALAVALAPARPPPAPGNGVGQTRWIGLADEAAGVSRGVARTSFVTAPPPFPFLEARVLLHLAGAAYTLSHLDPEQDADEVLRTPLSAAGGESPAADLAADLRGLTLLGSYSVEALDLHAYICRWDRTTDVARTGARSRPSAPAIVVAFRGSESAANWKLNFRMRLETASEPLPRRVMVHRGFQEGLRALEDQFHLSQEVMGTLSGLAADAESANAAPARALYVTGHSLGGALATLFAAQLCALHQSILPATSVFSFGSPRVGNSAFASFFNEECRLRSFRVAHFYDLAPRVPKLGPLANSFRNPPWRVRFKHVGVQVAINHHGQLLVQPHWVEMWLLRLLLSRDLATCLCPFWTLRQHLYDTYSGLLRWAQDVEQVLEDADNPFQSFHSFQTVMESRADFLDSFRRGG